MSFIAPVIHDDTTKFYDISVIKSTIDRYNIRLKAYSINEFVETTLQKENLSDMEKYTKKHSTILKINLINNFTAINFHKILPK